MTARLVILSAALALTACGGETQLTNVESGIRDQILYVNNGAEPEEIDPHVTTGLVEYYIQNSLFEGLVSKHPETLEPIPGVAEAWEVSADQTVYTFRLRSDARWSNGDPLTAQDFVYAWSRSLTPVLASEYAYVLHVIKNAAAYNRGEITGFTEVGVQAPDAHTLVVTLEAPTPWFLQLLDHHSAYPVHRQTIEQHSAYDRRGTGWTRPGNFVGNGPFRLKEWSVNKVLVVEKNPHYWNRDSVRLNEVHIFPIDNKQTEERMFRTGQIHMTLDGRVLTDKVEVYQKEQPDHIRVVPYLGIYYYLLNTARPPFNDIRVRRALSLAIDRESLARNVVKGGRRPAGAFTPPDTAGYLPEQVLKHDPVLARQLLAEAGYPDGTGFPRVELLYNTSSSHQSVATALQQVWKSMLNIDVTLVNQEWLVYLNRRAQGDYEIARAGWIADYADPNNFLELFTSQSGNNHSGWTDPDYDRLIAEANLSTNRQIRHQLFQQAESLLLENLPVIPLFYEASANLVHPSVQGLYRNVLTYYPFKYVYLSDTE